MSETTATETAEVQPEASASTGTKASRIRKTVKRPPESSPAELAAFVKAEIRPTAVAVAVLASLLKLPSVVVAAVKAEHGWDDSTLVSEQDLRGAVDAWLNAPANQKGK